MYRRSLLIILLSLLMSSAFANSDGIYTKEDLQKVNLNYVNKYIAIPVPVPKYKYVSYVGLQAAWNMMNFRRERDLTQPFGPTSARFNDRYSANGFEGTLYAGTGVRKYNNYYIALEGYASLSSTIYKQSVFWKTLNHHARIRVSLQHTLGFGVLPGYVITKNNLLYARVGLLTSNINVHTNEIGKARYLIDSGDKNIFGSRIGIGLENYISKHCSLRAEYTYTYYFSKTYNSYKAIQSYNKNSFHPRMSQLRVGMAFRW